MPPMKRIYRNWITPSILTVLVLISPFKTAQTNEPGSLKETWILNGSPSATQFSKWKSLPQPREIRVLLTSHPNSLLRDLKTVLPHVDRIQIGFSQFPTSNTIELWKSILAQGNIELISTSGSFPTQNQIEILNEIAPSRVIFVLGRYLAKGEDKIFKSSKFKYSMSFNLNRYPQFLEKFPIAELPKEVPIQIVVDYWPRYVQMDIWNLIPQTEKRLRISKSVVAEGNLPYLRNMKDMKELVFQSDGDVMATQWERLGEIPVRWVVQGAVPSEKSLKGFSDSLRFGAQRRLVVDRDENLTDAERTRLIASKLDIEWIHAAP